MRAHGLELFRILEAIAAVWRVYALEREVATALAWCLSIALDLPSLTFVACDRDVYTALVSIRRYMLI